MPNTDKPLNASSSRGFLISNIVQQLLLCSIFATQKQLLNVKALLFLMLD